MQSLGQFLAEALILRLRVFKRFFKRLLEVLEFKA
jgi:hypothetical protein